MPTDPNNTRYSLPFNYGDLGWDDELSNIMDQLAVEVPTKGTLANRPAADATLAPNYYYSTDQTPVLFSINIGGTWTDISLGGGGGGDGSFSGSHTDLTNVASAQHHEWPITAAGLSFDPATQAELNNHTTNLANPHDVTASQVGAIADSSGTVTPTNLTFDPATQAELDSHATNTSNPHGVTAEDAGAIVDMTGTVTTSHIAPQAVTPSEIDGRSGTSGQVLKVVDTSGTVAWGDDSGGTGSADFSSVSDMTAASGNTWLTINSAGGGGGISLWDAANNTEMLAAHEGVPNQVDVAGNLTVEGTSATVGGNEVVTTPSGGGDGIDIYVQDTQPAGMGEDDLWFLPQG